MEAFSGLKTPAFVLDRHEIDACLRKLVREDAGATLADRQTCNYYRSTDNRLIWVSRYGIDHRADTLLSWLRQAGDMGFSERAFEVETIMQDLQRLRSLKIGPQGISQLAAQLEFRLTKSCLRYCYGQRFGFVNPQHLLNNLDVEKSDTVKKTVIRG
jgi:hypothetical protein